MRTKHIELRARFRAKTAGLSPSSFPTDRSKAVLLLQFFSVVSYAVLVLSLIDPHHSFFWYLRGVWGLCFVIVAFPVSFYLQSTFNGSNIFWTMEIC